MPPRRVGHGLAECVFVLRSRWATEAKAVKGRKQAVSLAKLSRCPRHGGNGAQGRIGYGTFDTRDEALRQISISLSLSCSHSLARSLCVCAFISFVRLSFVSQGVGVRARFENNPLEDETISVDGLNTNTFSMVVESIARNHGGFFFSSILCFSCRSGLHFVCFSFHLCFLFL